MTRRIDDEIWAPRRFPAEMLAAPGQRWPVSRQLPREQECEDAIAEGFVGITTDGAAQPGLYRLRSTGADTTGMLAAARALLAALEAEQRAQLVFAVDAPQWRRWHGFFTRLMRHGLCFEDITANQRSAVLELVAATLGRDGFALVQDIRWTNQLVAELSGLFVDFGENVYWFSLFGEPSAEGPWGWQLDGHHINLNAFVLGDQVVLTPAFLGAEPAIVRHGPHGPMHLFHDHEAHGEAVMRALSPQLQRRATIAERLEPELFTGPFRDNFELRYEGVRVGALDGDDRERVRRVLADYAGPLKGDLAHVRLEEMTAHLDDTWFAWIGGLSPGDPFYYRLHSPVALIEFSHIFGVAFEGDEPSRNHIHTVVRTPNGNDYGRDLLRQHLEHDHF